MRSRTSRPSASPTSRACLAALAVLTLVLSNPGPVASQSPAFPFPQSVPYAPGSLRPDHRTPSELDDDVRAAYWRWKASYVEQAGTEPDGHPRFRVRTGVASSEPTVSEGQGYGMILVALMAGEDPDARTLFDGLWEFFDDHHSEIDDRLMDWYVPADESADPGSDDSAFDGDCDIAFGLLLAERQWGNSGRIDYRTAFEDVAAGLLESTIGPQSRLPELGDWVDTQGPTYNQYTPRTSDFMPGHFRAFARATGNDEWNEVAAASLQVVESLQTLHSPTTGLLPDFVVPTSAVDPTPKPAPSGFLEGPHDGHYYYNAGRDPWRLGVDALVNGDALSAAQSGRISSWVRTATADDPDSIGAGYELDGTEIEDYFTSFFAAPLGVAAMLDPTAQPWLNAVFDAVRDRQEGYYEDTVSLLCMLVMNHNFWDPTLVGETAQPCQPDAATLCLDGRGAGDGRFSIRVDFETTLGGGRSGAGQALPLGGLGIDRGGLFWFFDRANPEMLIKVLDGCAVNGHFWVFYSAGTSVGLELRITDTTTGAEWVGANPDLHQAPPVADTEAFACD